MSIASRLLLLCAALGLAACSNSGSAELRADQLAASIREQQVEHFVRTFALEAPTRAVRFAEDEANTPTIQAWATSGGLSFIDDPALLAQVTAFYEARGWQPAFLFGAAPNADGRQVIDLLVGADAHALDPAAYGAEAIVHHRQVLEDAGDLSTIYARLQLTLEDEAVLLAYMMDNAALDETLPASDAVFNVISRSEARDNPLPAFADATSALTDALERVATSGPELELRLAAGLIAYMRDMRYANPNRMSDEELETRGWTRDELAAQPERSIELAREALELALRDGTLTETLDALAPPGQQYERLVAGLARYREFMEQGGWEALSGDREIRRGERSDVIPALRRRLAAEDYWDGDLEGRELDSELSAALRYYQQTHQLNENGHLTEETIDSLGVPVERRIAQIMVSLDRWRQARVVRDIGAEHIFVNVPDFHAELWDAEEGLVHRWRVVAGRPRRYTDSTTGELVIEGRTNLFSDTMLYIVFNPYWNVPMSIRREEYDHLIAEDPKWLADNHFEIWVDETSGQDFLRQVPGPWNALGLVKFLFPNEHDIYMHDTPRRDLFERPIRAFSHGCIRVQDPMFLAELLLRRDRGWTERQTQDFIEETMEPGTEEWVSLRRPIPIHLEYFAVRGDDDGRMNFLADIYRLDLPLVDAIEAELRGEVATAP